MLSRQKRNNTMTMGCIAVFSPSNNDRQANRGLLIVHWLRRNTTYCGHTWWQDCTGWISLNELLASVATQLAPSTVNHKSPSAVLSQQYKHNKENTLYTTCFCPNSSLLLDTARAVSICVHLTRKLRNRIQYISRDQALAGSSVSVLKADGRLFTALCRLDGRDLTSGVPSPSEDYFFLLQAGRKWLGCAAFLDLNNNDRCLNKAKKKKKTVSASYSKEGTAVSSSKWKMFLKVAPLWQRLGEPSPTTT